MHLHSFLKLVAVANFCVAGQWPYDRYHALLDSNGRPAPNPSVPEFGAQNPHNEFANWLHTLMNRDDNDLEQLFANQSLAGQASFDEIWKNLDVPQPADLDKTIQSPHRNSPWSHEEATALFAHLPFELDQRCMSDKNKWWYRTYDGSCNWIKNGEMNEGQYGMAKSRDYGQYSYADGISTPREGPNPRAVSNAFFKRKETLYYEHTPLLLGLVEFIMHDITWSPDSTTEFIEVPMPDDEEHFAKNTTLRVSRTEAYPGTGTSPENPRENINRATTWLDLSSLYGSTADVATKLRSFEKGKLRTQELKTRGNKRASSYLPFNSMKVPTRTRPGVAAERLFAGGDPRTNEDWVMLGVHTLLLREHNRLCDILSTKHPEFDDEELYQTVRLLMSAKFSLIANAYQMAYFKDMPWPNDDGFPLYRQMSGKDWLEINPANNYPWPLATKNGKPVVVSAEMAVVYRFHEFIINSFPIKDGLNDTTWDQRLFDTAFNATGFIDAGLENILRGVVSTTIPNFKSGVDEDFRSAGRYRGRPFDIVVSSIVHEREQGLPTFNNYFRAYNKEGPAVQVPIRETFDDFSSDPVMVAELKRLYKTPDDVDLVVGCQLDESIFPHATVPTSALIISLFSLISMGNSDRFSIGFAAMRCLLVDKPWDCHPSNALEELLWKPAFKEGFPNFRVYDEFWLTELDFQAHGQNLLWRIVTENSEISCLQKNPLFPFDHETNPILCDMPKSGVDIKLILSTGVEVGRTLIRSNYINIVFAALVGLAGFLFFNQLHRRARGYPPVVHGLPILGKALDLQKNSKRVILEAFERYGRSKSGVFGIRLASLTHYLITQPEDIQMMIDDAPYSAKFDLNKFFQAINIPNILGQDNFATDLHSSLIRVHLGDPATVGELGKTVEFAAKHFLRSNPLVPAASSSRRCETLSGYLDQFITSVSTRLMLGADAYDNPELIDMFLQFNKDIDKIMGIGTILPSFLRFFTRIPMRQSYKRFQMILVPIIQRRRREPKLGQGGLPDFMPFVLEVVDDEKRASDLMALNVWFGLRNLQITLTSTLLDMINEPGLVPKVASSLSGATVENLNTFKLDSSKDTSWALLRSAMFESIRLCGPAVGPARIISAQHDVALASDPSVRLPPRQVATLSSFLSHRLSVNWGPDAAEYRAERFLSHDPDVGSSKFITWGLKGPHTCPGRWMAQQAICVMVKALLDEYTFEAEKTGLGDNDKYEYHAGVVTRKEVPVIVSRR